MNYTFSLEKEYFRLLAPIFITEEGVYKELPVDSGSAYLEVETVYYIVTATAGGELRVQSFANPPAKDKDGRVGGPVMFGTVVYYTEAGPSSAKLELTRSYNPRLTPQERAVLDAMWASLVADTPDWY